MIDLDGTLIHTAPEIAAAVNWMLTDLDLPVLPPQKVESYIGAGAKVLVQRCLTQQLGFAPDADFLAKAEALFFAHYAKNVSESKPYAGAFEGLQALSDKGFRLACVTNKPEQFTLPLLQKTGLADFFELVVSGDTLANKKPDPIQLQHICAKFDVPVYEAMLVGDSATDIQAAQAAGCFVVTVPYGYNQGIPIDVTQVDATIADLSELTQILSQ